MSELVEKVIAGLAAGFNSAGVPTFVSEAGNLYVSQSYDTAEEMDGPIIARAAIATVFDWLAKSSPADVERILMPLHDADHRSFLDWQFMLAERRKAALG